MLENLVNQLLAAVPPELLRGIAVALPTVPSVWAFIEWVLPATTSARTNHLTNILGNMAIYLGLQASGAVSFGTGWHGYVGAVIFSLLGTGATLALNAGIKLFGPVSITNPAGGK